MLTDADKNPRTEIEVTPEMETAGARFLCEHYPERTGMSDGSNFVDRAMARDLFLTMWSATPKAPKFIP